MNIPIIFADEIDPEFMAIEIVFKSTIENNILILITELIKGWYTVGFYQGYNGMLCEMSEIWIDDKRLGFTIDYGCQGQLGLDILSNAISGFAEINQVSVEKIIIGIEIEV